MNASPISMGLLSNRGPPSWHPAGETVRNKCRQAVDYCQVCCEMNFHSAINSLIYSGAMTKIRFSNTSIQEKNGSYMKARLSGPR